MCGLFVFLFRRKSPRTLVVGSLAFAAIGALIAVLLSVLWVPHWSPEIEAEFRDGWQPSPQTISEELAAYRGSWIDQMSDRVPNALDMEVLLFVLFYGWKAASLMLLGMALFKVGAFHARWNPRRYFALIASGLLVGIPLIVLGVVQSFAKNWNVRDSFFLGQYNWWGSYAVALGWVGLIMLWCQSRRLAWLKARMAALVVFNSARWSGSGAG
jgi:uncharacterized protein